MPRYARASMGGVVYHVLNRGNDRTQVFHNAHEYDAFVDMIAEACHRLPLPVLGYCIMPNHFHLVLWPQHDGDLGDWLHWLMTTHVGRSRKTRGGSGHIWQGRCKSFAVDSDAYYLNVLRYVECNALRANLAQLAEYWRWSSAVWRVKVHPPVPLSAGPIELPPQWIDYVNQPQTDVEVEALRKSVNTGAPYGSAEWIKRMSIR